MPFQSEKQRRYMHANLPDIAKRWERDYAGGGRIGFDSGSNGITLGSDKYNIKFEPGASGSWTETDLGEGQNIKDKNIAYGVDTTVNIGPVEIGMDYEKFLDKFDVTKDGTTVEKDTNRDRRIAYMLGLNLEDLYAKIQSDKDFKNFYLTLRYEFNQGGVVPAHEAGIYGLAEGGRTGFRGGSPHDDSPTGSGSSSSGTGGSTSTSTSGGEGGYQNVHQTGAVTQTPGRTPTTTDDRDGRTQALINISKQKKRPTYTGTEDLEEQLVVDKQNALNRLKFDRNLTKNERENLEVGLGFRPTKSKNKFMSFLGNAVMAIIPGLLPAKMATAFRVGKLGYDLAYTNKYDAKLEFLGINKNDILSKGKTQFKNEEKLRAETKKLQQALPKGHPERIALEAQKKTRTPPRDGPDGEGVNIKYTSEEITATNDAKADIAQLEQKYLEMNEASRLAWQQQQEDRSKQMAYWRMMMTPYMSAQGGRVPAGYNTGGLSNLFRLKNV